MIKPLQFTEPELLLALSVAEVDAGITRVMLPAPLVTRQNPLDGKAIVSSASPPTVSTWQEPPWLDNTRLPVNDSIVGVESRYEMTAASSTQPDKTIKTDRTRMENFIILDLFHPELPSIVLENSIMIVKIYF